MKFDNLSSKENNKRFSTPKFNQDQIEKEKNIINSLSRYELSSFDDSKYDSKKFDIKNPGELIDNEKSDVPKSSKEGIIYKDKNNFSICTLINNIDFDSNLNMNNNDISNKEKNNKCNKAQISFCDKSDNYSFKNEIIYKDKDINNRYTANINNKEINKEKNDIQINSFLYKPNDDIKHKKKEKKIKIYNNLNINEMLKDTSLQNSPKNIKNSNIKYNSSPYKYNLLLENDKIPIIKDFFSFHTPFVNKEKSEKKIVNSNNSMELHNINLNLKKINEINKKEKIYKKIDSIRNNIFLKSANYMTYSKKKVERRNTEENFKDYNILSNEPNGNNIIIQNKSLLEKGLKNNNKFINKITNKKKVLHSCGNYTKIKKKFKNTSINSSRKESQEKNYIFLSEKSNDKIINPRKKLEIIIKNMGIDMNINNQNKITKGNLYQNNNFQLKHNTYKLNGQNEFEIKKYYDNKTFNKNNENNSYIKNRLKSLSTKQKKFKNKKIIKCLPFELNDSLFNLKIKKIHDKKDINDIYSTNLTKESSNYNKDIIIGYKSINSKNFEIFKKSNNKKILKNKKYNNNSRNINNLYSSKIFNSTKDSININGGFNTFNFDNINLKNQIRDKKILNNNFNHKIKIDNTLHLNNKTKNVKFNFYNNDNKTINNKNNNKYNDININKRDKKKLSLLQKIRNNNNKNSNNNNSYNNPNNLIFNDKNKKKIIPKENKNDIYSKIKSYIINHSNTDKNLKINNDLIKIDNKSNKIYKNFFNSNNSTNSFNIINDSQFKKIKVNTRNKQKILTISPNITYNMDKKNNFLKIYKNPKNSCLLNSIGNINNSNDNINNYNNNYNSIYKINKYRENLQFTIFKRIKLNNFIQIENNSSSFKNENLKQQKNYYSINENINIEKEKQQLNSSQQLFVNKIYNNSRKIFTNNKNNSFKNKSSKIRNILTEDNNNNKNTFQINHKSNFNKDIIRFSIQRNNMNNQIIKEFSVIIGDKNKNNNLKEKNIIENNKSTYNSKNKKTIINVNQYYPSYFIKTNEIMKTKKNESEKK